MSHPSPHTAHHEHEHEHGHGHGHGHGPDHDYAHEQDYDRGAGDQTEILDLDAEVLAEHIASITAWLPIEASPRRIVDLGCGTGAGTLALLDRFPEAEVTAVDLSAAHLHRLREKAAAAGAADRVRIVQADLDATEWPELDATSWPDLGGTARPGLGKPELVWASASMHHVADPDRTLRQVHDLLAPGGLFAVVELAGFPRFLPEGAPEDAPGLEERCHAALDHHHAEQVPHRGADWGTKLTEAGFTVEGERTITVDIGPPHTDAVGRDALSSLRRMRGGVASALTAEDLTAFDRLLDTERPHSILRRVDLTVRTERTVWAARRT